MTLSGEASQHDLVTFTFTYLGSHGLGFSGERMSQSELL